MTTTEKLNQLPQAFLPCFAKALLISLTSPMVVFQHTLNSHQPLSQQETRLSSIDFVSAKCGFSAVVIQDHAQLDGVESQV